jgi:superoxide reductase
MARLGDYFQIADWKTEKHVPVIECPEAVSAGDKFTIEVSVGKEIPHPNTTEHHIRWIQLFLQPEGEKHTYQLGSFQFTSHGESVAGPDKGPARVEPVVTTVAMIDKPGTIFALSFCNIHGLWEGSKAVKII